MSKCRDRTPSDGPEEQEQVTVQTRSQGLVSSRPLALHWPAKLGQEARGARPAPRGQTGS